MKIFPAHQTLLMGFIHCPAGQEGFYGITLFVKISCNLNAGNEVFFMILAISSIDLHCNIWDPLLHRFTAGAACRYDAQ